MDTARTNRKEKRMNEDRGKRKRETRKQLHRELVITDAEIYQDRPYTFVKIEATWGVHDGTPVHEAFGFSKVMLPDKWSPEVGLGWAGMRAIRKVITEIVDMIFDEG